MKMRFRMTAMLVSLASLRSLFPLFPSSKCSDCDWDFIDIPYALCPERKELARGRFDGSVRSIDIDCRSVSALIPGREQVRQEAEGVIVMGLMGAPCLSYTKNLSHASGQMRRET
jgi:hypothetical protein